MFIDDKIFEFTVLEPEKIELLKQGIQEVCATLGTVEIRSALFGKIIVDANECKSEEDLKKFRDHYTEFNQICKIHLQYPHDLMFPAKIECASEKIQTIKYDCGFLYNYNFMQSATVINEEKTMNRGNNKVILSVAGTLNRKRRHSDTNNDVIYSHTNWYHDQKLLRSKFSKSIQGKSVNFSLEFDYSSFIKIYIHHHQENPAANHLTITVAHGYSPIVNMCLNNEKFTRVFDLPGESFWDRLIKTSAFQMNLIFESSNQCQDFISHLHFAITCPIVFLSQALPMDFPRLSLFKPPDVSTLPWELRYGIQTIMDCGDIGCYHFHQQSYMQSILTFVQEEKLKEAEAYLIAVHANLKLQPMMEVIEEPRPLFTNCGEDYVMMRTVVITPTRQLCYPPMQLMSSRAFRILGGAEKFVQVKFRDENMNIMKQEESMMQHAVLKPGLDGINIAGKMFYDLARSNSLFREHGSYFFQTDDKNKIITILKSLGNFKPEPSSKTAARIGQYFTSAKEVKQRLEPHEYAVIHDYYSETTNSAGEKFCFSDGVGIISLKFANSIKQEFQLSYLPSAFQIRCLGFKGVLSIDDKHPLLIDAGGDKLVLFRESQKKFNVSKSMEIVLGIVKHSAPSVARFNKPLINLWDQAAFKQGLSKQFDKRVNELFTANLYQITSTLTSSDKFKDTLQKFPKFINFQKCMRKTWIDEPFFRSMVAAAALQQLKALQTYKQITLPTELGRTLLGIVDITGILKEGQVFFQYSRHMSHGNVNIEKMPFTGKVAVSRSPVYNIGDLRILNAVDIPELRHLCDVIVFPNNGTRPHPDEMGGGDLDGDEYCVIWDPLLLLDHSEVAADYTPTRENPAKNRIEDLPKNTAHFRYEYMMKDYLAKISNCHLAHSDFHLLEHRQVLALAKKADIAVNYFKSGIAADDIPQEDMCDWYPDFMDKSHLPSYKSPRLLGRLHRKCDRFWNVASNIIEENLYSKPHLDPAYNTVGWEEYKAEAAKLYKSYTAEIEHLKSTYGISSEGELFSNYLGAILGRLRNFDVDNSSANTTKNLIQNHVFEIFGRYRKQFLASINVVDKVNGIDNPIDCISSKAQKLAVAYYKVAYEDGGSLSFPWIAWDALDKVWTQNDVPASSNLIYHFVAKEMDTSNIDSNITDTNIMKFTRRIELWLNNFSYQSQTLANDLDIVMAYAFNLDTLSQDEIEKEFSQPSEFGQKLVEFFASIGSFEFLELYPKMKLIHEAAQDTYCRIVFAPFTLNKPNVFKQRIIRGKAFVVAIPKDLRKSFSDQIESFKRKSGCSDISFRIRKQNRQHIHFYIWSQGTFQQNEALKEIFIIAPMVHQYQSFSEARDDKHRLQRLKFLK